MTTAEKQDAFLKILGRMIGTMSIEPSSRMGANRSAADVFNEMMDAAIAKAHEAMEESEKYAEVAEPEQEDEYEKDLDYLAKEEKEELVKTFTAIFEEHDASVLSKTAIYDGLRKREGQERWRLRYLLSHAETLGIVEVVSDGKTYQRYKLLINNPF